MKTIVITGLVLAIVLTSCKDAKNDKNDIAIDNDEDIILQEEEITDELPNPSDVSFITAFDEYMSGNYEKAAQYIENGVVELREEEKPTENLDGLLLDTEIEKIRSLENKVRTNKIEHLNVLAQAMANAEMLVAHDYLVYTVSTLFNEPVNGSYYFSKALRSLNNATLKLKGEAKEEAIKIRDDSRKLVKKVKDGDKNLDKDLKEQTKKIEDFLKKYKTELL